MAGVIVSLLVVAGIVALGVVGVWLWRRSVEEYTASIYYFMYLSLLNTGSRSQKGSTFQTVIITFLPDKTLYLIQSKRI